MFTVPDAKIVLMFALAWTVKITVLLGCAALVVFALRRGSSALRHHVWAAAIVTSLLLPFFIALLPAWHSTTLGSAAAAITLSRTSGPDSGVPAMPSVIVNATISSPVFSRYARAILLLWSPGFAFIFLQLLAGLVRLGCISKHSTRLFADAWMHEVLNLSKTFRFSRSVRLLECPSPLAMPLTWGFLRPVIVLPAGAARWPEERRRIVLSHELAHIARNDWPLQICAEFVRAVFWFHPLAWLAAVCLRHESERACDDAVLLSGVAPSHYASQLLGLARTLKNSGRVWSAALAIARPSNLERRFAAMLNPSVNRSRLSLGARFLIPLFAAVVLIPLAALRLPAQNLSGRVTGTIFDPSGAAVPNATIIMSNHAANTIDMTGSDREGNFVFKALPTGNYEFQVLKPGFKPYRVSEISLDSGRDFSQTINLEIGGVKEEMKVVAEGTSPSVVSKDDTGKPSRIHVGGNIQEPKIVAKVAPVYPSAARSAGVEGTVVLHAVIGKDGKLLSLQVMNSQVDPELARSALEAVSHWRYTPTLLNGEPIEIDTTIDIVYSLK